METGTVARSKGWPRTDTRTSEADQIVALSLALAPHMAQDLRPCQS